MRNGQRHLRVVPDVVPSAAEREAHALAQGEGAAGRVRAVARHPDLAERIRLAYQLADIRQWSGYMPPREWSGYNDSPLRRTVVETCAEAFRRENTHSQEA